MQVANEACNRRLTKKSESPFCACWFSSGRYSRTLTHRLLRQAQRKSSSSEGQTSYTPLPCRPRCMSERLEKLRVLKKYLFFWWGEGGNHDIDIVKFTRTRSFQSSGQQGIACNMRSTVTSGKNIHTPSQGHRQIFEPLMQRFCRPVSSP